MDNQAILEQLLALLQASGVAIRNEPLGGSGGGLCFLKGRPVFFVDTQATTADVAVLSAQALTKVADIESMFIKPQVRAFIEKHGFRGV